MEVTLTSGQRVAFDVELSERGEPSFILSLTRSGSSFVNEMAESLALAAGRRVVQVGLTFFKADVAVTEYSTDPALIELIRPGNVYGGFRQPPTALTWSPAFMAGRKILFVRDPRDALVSFYFSAGWSHQLPDSSGQSAGVHETMAVQRQWLQGMSIDEAVLRHAQRAARELMGYLPWVFSPKTLLLRYEDHILDKVLLAERIAEHLGWEIDAAELRSIAAVHDVFPEGDRPGEFVRQVLPGDHARKLRPDTVEALDIVLRDVMRAYGYPCGSPSGAAA
jgi:hypothetical protein